MSFGSKTSEVDGVSAGRRASSTRKTNRHTNNIGRNNHHQHDELDVRGGSSVKNVFESKAFDATAKRSSTGILFDAFNDAYRDGRRDGGVFKEYSATSSSKGYRSSKPSKSRVFSASSQKDRKSRPFQDSKSNGQGSKLWTEDEVNSRGHLRSSEKSRQRSNRVIGVHQRPQKVYRCNGSEYNQNITGLTQFLYPDNEQLIFESQTPLKSLKILLKQFDGIEKRQWPNFLHDLDLLFQQKSFSRSAVDKPHRVVDDCTRTFSRILTTKLFPDIMQHMINCLTSLTMALRHSCKEIFKWIFEFYRESSDDTKIVLLKSVEGAVENKFKGLHDNLPFLSDKLMKVLDATDFEATLIMIQVTNVFVTFSQSFPSAFQREFGDITDVMIAWYLESAMNPLIISCVKDAFLSFHSFWYFDLATTEGLLRNFIEDVEDIDSILKEDFKNNESILKTTRNLMKMSSLIDVYVVVSRALSLADETETQESSEPWTFAAEALMTVVAAVTHAIGDIQLHEHLIIACNDCAIFTLEKYSEYGDEGVQIIIGLSDVLLPYMDLVFPNLVDGSTDFIVSTLKLQNELVKILGTANKLPVDFITKSLSVNSCLQPLRFLPSKQVHLSLYQLHHSLLSLKSLPLLEETYKLLLVELQVALSICFNTTITLTDQHESLLQPWSASQARFIAMSVMLSLSELATTTSSVIGMWALKPSFFDLMVTFLNPTDKHFMDNPDIQSMLLNLLTSHSKKHHHFISSSNLFQSSKPSSNSFVIETPTSHHLSRILSLITCLAKEVNLNRENRITTIQWFMNILTECGTNAGQLLEKSQVSPLLEMITNFLFCKDSITVIQSANIMHLVVRRCSSLSDDVLAQCKDACVFHLTNSFNQDVRSSAEKLLLSLPVQNNFVGINSLITDRQQVLYPEDLDLAMACLMKREQPNNGFTAASFSTIMAFLLEGKVDKNEEHDQLDWLRELFCSSLSDQQPLKQPSFFKACGINIFQSQESLQQVFESNRSVLLFWATWEVASFCVANKLKTPLGKPQDLLTKIGQSLNSMANEASFHKHNGVEVTVLLIRAKMLLSLMELLDKHMDNAVNGTSFRMSSTSTAGKTFFKANHSTCNDWLTRSRLSVMKLGLNINEPTVVWRHGVDLLKQLIACHAKASDIEVCLSLVIEALVQLEDRDSIQGLCVWIKNMTGHSFSWSRPAMREALDQLENVSTRYESLLKEPACTPTAEEFVRRHLVKSYVSIGSFQEAVEWSSGDNFQLKVFANSHYSSETSLLGLDSLFAKLSSETQEALKGSSGLKRLEEVTLKSRSCLRSCLLSDVLDQKSLIRLQHLSKVSDVARDPKHTLKLIHQNYTDSLEAVKWNVLLKQDLSVETLLQMCKISRKTDNLKTACLMLKKLAQKIVPFTSETESKSMAQGLLDVINSLSQTESMDAVRLLVIREACKQLKSVGEQRKAIEILHEKLVVPSSVNDQVCGKILSKNLVTLSKLLELDSKFAEQLDKEKKQIVSVSPTVKNIQTRILQEAIKQDKSYAKPHLLLANWSFKAAKQLDHDEDNNNIGKHGNDSDGLEEHYSTAVVSYTAFLDLNENGGDDINISVALKLLSILCRQSNSTSLKEVLKTSFEKTSWTAWKHVSIQLFSRLSDTENDFTRKIITCILCKIGQENPQSIAFTAVSGSLDDQEKSRLITQISTDKGNRSPGDLLSLSNPDDREDLNNFSGEEVVTQMTRSKTSCYSSLLQSLSLVYPDIIRETGDFIREMRRITVLWDEMWTAALLSWMPEIKKRVTALEDEVGRIKNTNSSLPKTIIINLMKHKYMESFGKIRKHLEELRIATLEAYPETPYEKWFQSNFSKEITKTMTTIDSQDVVENPSLVLTACQQLLSSLQKKSQEMSTGKSQLILDTISPLLASVKDSEIPMPGLKPGSQATKCVKISKIHKTVMILHTKTRPKKISFFGSDGQVHNYLFKGHEDLHLDERIMQMLEVVNKMFLRYEKKSGKLGSTPKYRTRPYSVTPLGSKSGLIEWVDGCPSLFGFYKRWHTNTVTVTQTGDRKGRINETSKCKPSEMWFKKLKEKGIETPVRKDWPKEVLLEVFNELSNETSPEVISKELWHSSVSCKQFYQLTQAFTRSTAVMSMIGYVIGLGDRHLDNILLDMSTGDLIHVDFNVCFEKGRSLRVAEKVPCRLTKSIVNAFGLTGVEGTFRLSCEHVLNILRKERDVLMMLFESFIYDPLVEWNVYLPSDPTSQVNPYAFKALKKIKWKLEGRDPDASKRLSVPEQVDSVIKQAMDVANLSLMYEGWTSWV